MSAAPGQLGRFLPSRRDYGGLRSAGKTDLIRSLQHHKYLFASLADAVEHARSHVRRSAAASV